MSFPGNYYFYLQRPGSLMTKRSTVENQIDFIEAMEEIVQFASKEKQDVLRGK